MANPFTPEEVSQILEAFFAAVGTRQYIGARYVPIFGRKGEESIEWDNSKPYEPLTIVLYQGDSFTSRQYVPAGVEITNQEFWANTGNFNGQIEQYKNLVNQLDGKITQLNADLNALDERTNETIDAFKDEVDTEINDFKSDVADAYIPFPDGLTNPKYGDLDQVLATLANGKTKWVNPVEPTDEQADTYITAWLNAHPEATTTVQDGAITLAKLNSDVTNAFMRYRGSLQGDISDALVGTYAVNKNNVTGMPDDAATYCWLSCLIPNNVYVAYDSSATNKVWIKQGTNAWSLVYPLADNSVTLSKLDSNVTNTFMHYRGPLQGDISDALVGTYAVNKNNVTGMPDDAATYCWLTCLIQNNVYVAYDSSAINKMWIKQGNNAWSLVYPKYTNPRFEGKQFLYNGDSIAESRMTGFSSNGGGYPEIISKLTGSSYTNYSVGGGTLADVSGSPHVISNTISTMSDSADLICLEGGINDYWRNVPLGSFSESDFTGSVDNTTICGALESIFRQAINKWIGKPIIFVIVHKITTTAWTANSAGYTFAEAREKIISICEKYSIPYIDMWSSGGLNAYMSALDNAYLNGGSTTHPDGCHPDENGYKLYYVPRMISVFDSILPY